MIKKDVIKNLVFAAIDEVNSILLKDDQILKSVDLPLSGTNSSIGSLQLINLIVAIEHQIEITFNKSIMLTDERAMNYKPFPFTNINTLVDFIITTI